MKLIVGLGNPGRQYEETRHNAGFKVLDGLGTESGAKWQQQSKLLAQIMKTQLAGQEVILAKPQTFMNESGKAVQALLHWFKIAAGDLLVVHDDTSLPLGKLRLQKAGSAGGQHGVESIIEYLGGEKNFNRLKIGVGPDPGGDKRADFVLSSVGAEDKELYQLAIVESEQAALFWLRKGIDQAMNYFNSKVILITN